jgi:DNA-binding MarR family transcriptional regulator
LVLAVFRAHQALVNEGDRRVADIGLTSARWKVLGAIALSGEPLSASEIGRRMGLTRQAAQKQVDGLRRARMLHRRANPADRRAPLFVLTDEGEKAFARADAVWNRWASSLGSGIDEARWRDATALLDLLVQRVEGTEP